MKCWPRTRRPDLTIMNGNIRAELTRLLADHLNEQHCVRIIQGSEYPTSVSHFHNVAVDVMDYMYGSEDGDVPQPEQPEVEADPDQSGQRDLPVTSCCNGFTCGCCPGSVDSVDPGTVLGVMNPEPLRPSFVYLGPPSRTEEYVPVLRSGSVLTPPSPQGSGSADE